MRRSSTPLVIAGLVLALVTGGAGGGCGGSKDSSCGPCQQPVVSPSDPLNPGLGSTTICIDTLSETVCHPPTFPTTTPTTTFPTTTFPTTTFPTTTPTTTFPTTTFPTTTFPTTTFPTTTFPTTTFPTTTFPTTTFPTTTFPTITRTLQSGDGLPTTDAWGIVLDTLNPVLFVLDDRLQHSTETSEVTLACPSGGKVLTSGTVTAPELETGRRLVFDVTLALDACNDLHGLLTLKGQRTVQENATTQAVTVVGTVVQQCVLTFDRLTLALAVDSATGAALAGTVNGVVLGACPDKMSRCTWQDVDILDATALEVGCR